MNFAKLMPIQKQLDDRIVKDKGLTGQYLMNKKVIALQTELGELANELPEVFKYWSNKKNNYEKALKEYVDCLHFILSIGNDFAIECTYYRADKSNDIEEQMQRLFKAAYLADVKMHWNYLINLLYGLGEMLGFTWEEIEGAYMEKNNENHIRQENNY